MKIINSNEISIPEGELVATVGFFDGVHLGHRFLIDEVKKKAEELSCKSAVVTFLNHPRKVLHADFQPQLLTTFDEKMELLARAGIDYCIVLDFDSGMSKLSAFDFLQTIVFQKFHVKTLFVGHDHRFGHNRAEGFPEYLKYGREIGIDVIQASRFSMPEFSHVSSSDIRNALQTANVRKANALLGYKYCIDGKVTEGFKIGRKLGFPTANIQVADSEKLIPAPAVYAVKVVVDGSMYSGMMNIGVRPTVSDGLNTTLEVNIFDFDADIYNREIKIIFTDKIRNEQRFNSLDELVVQLHSDKSNALQLLNSAQ